MQLLYILYLTIGLTLLFATLPKKLHLLEHWLIWMVFVFFYTSFLSVIVDNAKLWVLADQEAYHWHFKLTQIVLLPVMVMFYLQLMLTFQKITRQIIVTITFIIAFLLVEQLLQYTNIIEFRDWSIAQSIIAWVIILTVIVIVQKWFRKLLVKEGVMKQ
ncbi:hypothetical protein CIB95_00850 [Lottiidibacillus patelloidae]|uniref:Uncharacterized protein n=1 Tax=Lottiidibacillus patelloidae TaxID=2670334 RepID=A0A263BX55_9BACI|nr:hypothetical protein [Lottiidibacillus patelloidae]OZM58158.1 hypothetical protein CIB95_00850 [Lottiidibacillus patelloidae]